MTALPAPHCFSFSLFYTLYLHALSHALARASPYCSPSHVIVLSAHCFPMYLTSFDRHLETLVSTSCLQVSPHVLRSVDTSLNTSLSPALPVEPSSSLAAQRPARRSCLSRSSSPLRSTPSRNNGHLTHGAVTVLRTVDVVQRNRLLQLPCRDLVVFHEPSVQELCRGS